jgi:hypothetical protein
MSRIRALLRYLRIEGDDGDLSLTTLAFAIAGYCLLTGKQIDLAALGAFTVAVAAHRHREALGVPETEPPP